MLTLMQALERVPHERYKIRQVYDHNRPKHNDPCPVCDNEFARAGFVSVWDSEDRCDIDIWVGVKCLRDLGRVAGK